MDIHPAYIHTLADQQPAPMYRIPVYGIEPPLPLGAIVACLAVAGVLLVLAFGVLS